MFEMTCPWCEVQLPLSFADQATEQTCPECRTTWCYEDEVDHVSGELRLAA